MIVSVGLMLDPTILLILFVFSFLALKNVLLRPKKGFFFFSFDVEVVVVVVVVVLFEKLISRGGDCKMASAIMARVSFGRRRKETRSNDSPSLFPSLRANGAQKCATSSSSSSAFDSLLLRKEKERRVASWPSSSTNSCSCLRRTLFDKTEGVVRFNLRHWFLYPNKSLQKSRRRRRRRRFSEKGRALWWGVSRVSVSSCFFFFSFLLLLLWAPRCCGALGLRSTVVLEFSFFFYWRRRRKRNDILYLQRREKYTL